MSTSNTPKYLQFSFSPSVRILSWFGSSIPSIKCLFPLFLMSMGHFSAPDSIPISWQHIFIVCIRVSNSFSIFFCKQLDVVHVHKAVNLFLRFSKSVATSVQFLSRWLSGIIAITNNNGESASPWKMSLWIFISNSFLMLFILLLSLLL